MVDPDRPATEAANHGHPGPARPRIALVHDWLCGHRGGEAVLERLAHVCAAPEHLAGELVGVYTMFDDGRGMGAFDDGTPRAPIVDAHPHVVSTLGRLPLASGRLRKPLLPLYPGACADLSRRLALAHAREPLDLVVSSSSAWVKNVRAPAGVPHVCYCHAPMRYIGSRKDDYATNPAMRLALTLAGGLLRPLDRRGSRRVTRFVANSRYIAGEIRREYGRESDVVHPPARTSFFTPDPGAPRDGFWLVGGALEPYKKTGLAIEAALRAGKPVRVFGQGSELPALRKRYAGCEGVAFLGKVGDLALRELFRKAEAYLFPQVEDFGIAAVEAQACGCPVVARRKGGALDSVIEHETGAFFDDTPDATAPEAIALAGARAAGCDPSACRRHAERFTPEAFDQQMRTILAGALGGA
ncbi:MAG: glycosyltransferase [Phycisphaerales bacterium]|nr:MAG: glycosyltransferase [Phycisphaerales bacterium]